IAVVDIFELHASLAGLGAGDLPADRIGRNPAPGAIGPHAVAEIAIGEEVVLLYATFDGWSIVVDIDLKAAGRSIAITVFNREGDLEPQCVETIPVRMIDWCVLGKRIGTGIG